MPNIIRIKTDGSHLPETNIGTISCVLKTTDRTILRRKKVRCESNAVAEYQGILLALDHTIKYLETSNHPHTDNPVERIFVYTDWVVALKQISGKSKISVENLRPLCYAVRQKVKSIHDKFNLKVEFYWIRRNQNLLADVLCKCGYADPIRE